LDHSWIWISGNFPTSPDKQVFLGRTQRKIEE
jgi:hypothetical protein